MCCVLCTECHSGCNRPARPLNIDNIPTPISTGFAHHTHVRMLAGKVAVVTGAAQGLGKA